MKKLVGSEIKEVPIYEELCDICEQVLGLEQGRQHDATIKFNFGYASRKYDGDVGTVVICTQCAEHLLEQYLWVKKPGHRFISNNVFGGYTGEMVEKERIKLGYTTPLSVEQFNEIYKHLDEVYIND